MKKFLTFLCAVTLVLGLMGTASATTFFWDDVLPGGGYTYINETQTMVFEVQTQYNPYDSGDGVWSSGGTGTIIDWTFTAVFDDAVDEIVDGGWDEEWGSSFRIGLFDDGTATYVRTGTNDLGQNTGIFSAQWSAVTSSNAGGLNPPGPWYAVLDLTRVTYEGTPYTSSGTVTGAVGNDPPAPVPEPSTILLMGIGLLGLVGYSRKRSKKS